MTTAVRLWDGRGTEAAEAAEVRVDGGRVTITALEVEDPDLAALLQGTPVEGRPEGVRRVLAVGVRGIATMGIGLDVAAVDERIRQTLGSMTTEAERRLEGVIEAGRAAMAAHFDPETRSSLLSKMVAEITSLRDGFLGGLDPSREGSHTTEFLARLAAVVGPEGSLEQRIAAALDPDADGSALAGVVSSIEARFAELRDLIVRERGVAAGRAEEAGRGTAQGIDFEDEVEESLRRWAAGLGGCVVERVGRTGGDLGTHATVGDFVVTLPDGARVVVEAKNQATIGLGGRDGILGELDRAMSNRGATAAICVSRRDAFPAEAGRFAVYGSRVLVVDEGDGLLTGVALQWARARAVAEAAGRPVALDAAVVAERIAEIRRQAEGLSAAKATLTNIRTSVDSLSDRLTDIRKSILATATEVEREVAGGV